MASSTSSSSIMNVNRVTGLGTGLDIESIISQTLKAKQGPLNKLKQKEQTLLWKQDAYRQQNTALSSLQDLLFNLKLETTYNTRKATSSNTQAVSATVTPNSPSGSYNLNVTQLATAAVNSSSSSLTVGASVTSNFLTEATFGANHNTFSLVVDGVAKTITIPPSAYGTYKPGDASGKSLEDLAKVIQTQLNNAGFATPVSVKTTTDQELVFYTGKSSNGTNHTLVFNDISDSSANTTGTAVNAGVNTLTLDSSASGTNAFYVGMTMTINNGTGAGQTRTVIGYDAATQTVTLDKDWDVQPDATSNYSITNESTLNSLGLHNQETSKGLVGKILVDDPSKKIIVDANNKKFKIAIGNGTYQEVTLTEKAGGYTISELAQEIETQIRALKTQDLNLDQVRVSATNYNQLCIETVASDNKPLTIQLASASTIDFLQEMGFNNGASSNSGQNGLNSGVSLYSQKDNFLNSDFFDSHTPTNGNATFSFAINGQSFTFSVSNTLDDIVKAINANQAAGVTAFYDSYKDKLVLTSNQSGDLNADGSDIQLVDNNNFLSQVMGIIPANEVSGKNAIVSINGYETQQKGNSFTLNNTTFNLTGVGMATIAVTADTAGITDKVQAFIDKYNSVIASMNAEVTESRVKVSGSKYDYYEPLTDEQRESLSEDQIKQWEEKAKQGILHNDSILSGCLQEMRINLAGIQASTASFSGTPLSGTINLVGANRFVVTYGTQTREIQLDERAYTSGEYGQLATDMQQKLDATFGKGAIQVAVNGSNQLSLTTNNTRVTLNNGSSNSGLAQLGFNDGAAVKTTVNSLAQIGITTAKGEGAYQENGKLYLDKDKLTTALLQDPDGVIRLLTNSGLNPDGTTNTATEGIFHKLYNSVQKSMNRIKDQAGSTGTVSATNMIGKQLIQLADQITTAEDRLSAEEDRLYAMYNRMDTLIGQMNNQMAAIQSFFGNNNS